MVPGREKCVEQKQDESLVWREVVSAHLGVLSRALTEWGVAWAG